MILTSTTEKVRFTPAAHADKPGPPVYLLRAGSVIERGQLEAELAGPYRAGRVYGYELRAAIQSGVATLLAGDAGQDRMFELVAREEEAMTAAAEAIAAGQTPAETTLNADEQRALAEMRRILAEHWPEYRELVAQLERRRELAPVLAFRRFCAGWENVGTTFARGPDGLVSDTALRGLSEFDIIAAGNYAYGLLYAGGQEGNSVPPYASASGPATSSSDALSPAADGTSPAKGGRRTRAPRSRRGSGASSTSGS